MADKAVVLDLDVQNGVCAFSSSIEDALKEADAQRIQLDEQLSETLDTIKALTPECDKLDYILAASSGALCGLLDVSLIGKPGESPIGTVTDQWYGERVIDFAKRYSDTDADKIATLKDAIIALEDKYKVPYDQSVGGDVFKELLNITPKNHHFKSLPHNPTLMGLFFSILNQFDNTSDFVSEGLRITLKNSDSRFELQGHDVPSKIFSGIANWVGHLVSDVSGSQSSKGRGMGIPAPILAWTNDVIVIKDKLKIPASEFDKAVSDLAIKMFEKGYDIRFATGQLIPVFVNEMTVRLLYAVRRLLKYFADTPKEARTTTLLWRRCEPFSNATVKRMLTVAHGTFCVVDTADAAIRGVVTGEGTFNLMEFCLRLNVAGIGRFTISLYGEVTRGHKVKAEKENVWFLQRERILLDNYIEGLKALSQIYDDKDLLNFAEDFKDSRLYKEAFAKTASLAEQRGVPDEKILRSKADIDAYFMGGFI